MQSDFLIYGTPTCVFCNRAKTLIESRGLTYSYIDITVQDETGNRPMYEELQQKVPGVKTVPQIFSKSGFYVGGHDDLVEYFNEIDQNTKGGFGDDFS